jgi:hypothetical protein
MLAITTFSPKGYELYGKRFLETFVEHWPCNIVVYYEELPDFKHEKVTYKPLMEVFGMKAFLSYCDKDVFKGQTSFGYNYNFDARKFSFKVFAQFDALKNNKGKVIWLDADTITKKPVTEEFINGLFGELGQEACLSFLGRRGFHCESGFVGFDTDHPDFEEFFERYENCYRRGQIFKLERWHDCEALQWAIDQSGVNVNNLSPFWKTGDDLDVMPKTVLGEYLTHFKGRQKSNPNLH